MDYYNTFVSYAHPPIDRGGTNVHKIGSHIPVVADPYPQISLNSGFNIVATGRKKLCYFISKNLRSKSYYLYILLLLLIIHMIVMRYVNVRFLIYMTANYQFGYYY